MYAHTEIIKLDTHFDKQFNNGKKHVCPLHFNICSILDFHYSPLFIVHWGTDSAIT